MLATARIGIMRMVSAKATTLIVPQKRRAPNTILGCAEKKMAGFACGYPVNNRSLADESGAVSSSSY